MINTSIENQVQKAKVQLLLNYPFFASLLLKMNTSIVKDDDAKRITTAATDGVNLYVNPEFFGKLNQDEQIGLLAHEVLHPAFLHHTRREGRHSLLWNIACDYAINPILLESGLKLPEGGLNDNRFAGMTADRIYNIIYEEADKVTINVQWASGEGFEGGIGDVMDFPGLDPMDDNSPGKQLEEQKQIQGLIAAHQIAKSAGKGSAGIERLIKEFLDPKVDWRTELQRIVSEKTYDDYSWVQPNRRHIGRGFYLPTLDSETFGQIALLIDTSGSIGQRQLNVFAGECNGIGGIAKSEKWAIYCDTKVNDSVDFFEGEDEVVLTARGGGGTDFRPPFIWMHNNDIEPKIAIYFTDGYCNDFPSEVPDYPVIWALYDGKDSKTFNPPFGDVIEIPKDMK